MYSSVHDDSFEIKPAFKLLKMANFRLQHFPKKTEPPHRSNLTSAEISKSRCGVWFVRTNQLYCNLHSSWKVKKKTKNESRSDGAASDPRAINPCGWERLEVPSVIVSSSSCTRRRHHHHMLCPVIHTSAIYQRLRGRCAVVCEFSVCMCVRAACCRSVSDRF